MRKISFVLALIIITCAVLTACSRSYKAYSVDPDYVPENTGSNEISFQDLEGNKVTVKKDLSTIVCFSPEAAIIIRGIGSQKLIKAVDDATTNAVAASNVIKADEIAAQNPDLVFINDTYDVDSIIDDSIPCVKVPSTMTINDTKALIKLIEKALGSKKDSLADKIDSQMSIAQAATSSYVNKYSTFIDLGELKTVGGGNYINEIISISGGENIFSDREGTFEASKADIVAANPTFIFTTNVASFYTRDPELRDLDAVKNDRVIKIEPAMINYASQNIADVISTMFENINAYKNANG